MLKRLFPLGSLLLTPAASAHVGWHETGFLQMIQHFLTDVSHLGISFLAVLLIIAAKQLIRKS